MKIIITPIQKNRRRSLSVTRKVEKAEMGLLLVQDIEDLMRDKDDYWERVVMYTTDKRKWSRKCMKRALVHIVPPSLAPQSMGNTRLEGLVVHLVCEHSILSRLHNEASWHFERSCGCLDRKEKN